MLTPTLLVRRLQIVGSASVVGPPGAAVALVAPDEGAGVGVRRKAVPGADVAAGGVRRRCHQERAGLRAVRLRAEPDAFLVSVPAAVRVRWSRCRERRRRLPPSAPRRGRR